MFLRNVVGDAIRLGICTNTVLGHRIGHPLLLHGTCLVGVKALAFLAYELLTVEELVLERPMLPSLSERLKRYYSYINHLIRP